MKQSDTSIPALIIRTGPRSLELHERYKLGRSAVGVQIFFCVIEIAQIFARNVDAATFEIFAHIAQDIGELQCDAEVDRIRGSFFAVFRIFKADHPTHHETDYGSNAIAEYPQIFKRFVSGLIEIHAHAFDQFERILP